MRRFPARSTRFRLCPESWRTTGCGGIGWLGQDPRYGRFKPNAALGLTLAFEFAGAVALFWFFGWLVDRWLGSDPWGQVAGGVVGWIGGILHVYYAVQRREGRGSRW